PTLLDHSLTPSSPHPLTVSSPHFLTPARPPRPLTTLIGREEAAAAVTDLVISSRLVTLVGGGGVGKARLALQVAPGPAGRGPRSAGGCPFAAGRPPALPGRRWGCVAAAVGLEEAGETAGTGSLVQTRTYRLSPQPTQLVLDNCERLTQAVEELAQRLLAAC